MFDRKPAQPPVQSIEINEKADQFYEDFYAVPRSKLFEEITDENYFLKRYFVDLFEVNSMQEAKASLIECVNDYYKKLTEENGGYLVVPERFADNIKNIFKEEKKTINADKRDYLEKVNIKGKKFTYRGPVWDAEIYDTNSSSRETLFKIAFALGYKFDGFKAAQCNEMLEKAGQNPIHIGGDPQESIVYFCLEKKQSYLTAVCLYEKYCQNEPLTGLDSEEKGVMSQRSRLASPKMIEAIQNSDYEESLKDFEEQLYSHAAMYSYYSGRARRYVLDRIAEKKNKKFPLDKAFSYVFCREEREIERAFDKIIKGSSYPTRNLICLMLTMEYFLDYEQNRTVLTLKDYLNLYLGPDKLGLLQLDKTRRIDALLLELSRYDLSQRKRNWIRYDKETWVVFDEWLLHYDETELHLAAYIIKRYILDKYKSINPITSAELIKKECFFEKLKTTGEKKK